MEITGSGSVSGAEIIDAVCRQVRDRLSRSDSLRAVDCYRSFHAKVAISLTLMDVDQIDVREVIEVGESDSELQQIAVQRQNLERPVVGRERDVSGRYVSNK